MILALCFGNSTPASTSLSLREWVLPMSRTSQLLMSGSLWSNMTQLTHKVDSGNILVIVGVEVK